MPAREILELIGLVGGIIVTLIAVVKGIAALVRVIVDFVASMRELTSAITRLTNRFDQHTSEVLGRLHSHDTDIADHETRLTVLDDWRNRSEFR